MITQTMKERHSVRAYENKPLEQFVKQQLGEKIAQCNAEGDLHIQLITDEPKAFDCFLARYGKFSNVTNYIALVGKDDKNLVEKSGYFGEQIVLYAQSLGLNTCWVALTYKKTKAIVVEKGEKLCLVIAIGYGATQGVQHKQKSIEEVSCATNPPEWFTEGVKAALLAPTAMNQQKFKFTLCGDKVKAESGSGACVNIDLGIVKYHFELGAGKENFEWA